MSVSGTDEPAPLAGAAQDAALAKLMHELRTPLMAMGTAAELLSEDLDHLERPAVRQLVATLHRSAVWLHQLVDNLHGFAALAQEPGVPERVPVDLCTVVHETERVLGPLLATKNQFLEVLAPAALPRVDAVPRLLGQVCLNLLSNASKFAPAGSPLRVVLIPTEAGVRVAIEDRGPGFPAAVTARLFEPFYQVAASPAGTLPGVGLGLAIVQEIIAAHGGRVGAENRRGGGARFWFELPRSKDAAGTYCLG
jgi:signal transduction histidine kinase